MNENIIIRLEEEKDYKQVEKLVKEAFWNVYREGAVEHYLIHVLRDDKDFIKELDFVMEVGDEIIGQNVFVRAKITADDGREIPVLTMGPVSIAKKYQRRGYGKILLDYCLQKAKDMGFGAVCIEGNIDFYGKCGFDFGRNFSIRYHGLPEGVDDSFFLINQLIDGFLDNLTGEYATPQAYFVDEKIAQEYNIGG